MKYKDKRRKSRDKVRQHRTLKKELMQTRGKKCERCGYNKLEILQIHHIDKDRNNNKMENLKLLCPNCHAEEHFLKSE
jgi:5-methylcytosine-specific restriction endonuclease McrA